MLSTWPCLSTLEPLLLLFKRLLQLQCWSILIFASKWLTVYIIDVGLDKCFYRFFLLNGLPRSCRHRPLSLNTKFLSFLKMRALSWVNNSKIYNLRSLWQCHFPVLKVPLLIAHFPIPQVQSCVALPRARMIATQFVRFELFLLVSNHTSIMNCNRNCFVTLTEKLIVKVFDGLIDWGDNLNLFLGVGNCRN
jgi:hypothetical protein